MKRQVRSVHQSPMNAQRWLLVLECSHELWITSARQPKLWVSSKKGTVRKSMECPTCTEREARK